ncbi:uncharacterized protein PHACADRAFT_71017, partial [Phanerochaete carnosa HHB-10118-sp]
FELSLPFPEYTSVDAIRNGASHWLRLRKGADPPPGLRSPDLGPKFYIAPGDRTEEGTTRLHKDMCAAVNIMAYCAPDPLSKKMGAIWHIFMALDSETVSMFLREKHGLTERDPDPLLGQRSYLNEQSLNDLWTRHKVRPFRIVQKEGEAVFIPPRAAHQ